MEPVYDQEDTLRSAEMDIREDDSFCVTLEVDLTIFYCGNLISEIVDLSSEPLRVRSDKAPLIYMFS